MNPIDAPKGLGRDFHLLRERRIWKGPEEKKKYSSNHCLKQRAIRPID
jgi:hypothetical protein